MAEICTVSKLIELIPQFKERGQKIVICHGTFDLLHPGHIKHLQEAKRQGDLLIVTITAAQFVSKGPGRPVFNDQLRVESISALQCVDYVALHQGKDAETLILDLKPDIYVKGKEYAQIEEDVTGKIKNEINSVKKVGGKIYFTEDPTIFSSSHLLNHYFDAFTNETQNFLKNFKTKYSKQNLYDIMDSLSKCKVLIIGDAIIDEYQFVETLGQAGKGFHLAAKCLKLEYYPGGTLCMANQMAEFSDNVTLITGIGKNCPHTQSILQHDLNKKITSRFHVFNDDQTLTKRRYVHQDGKQLNKLFETYSGHSVPISSEEAFQVFSLINESLSEYDLVLLCDYGNGFTNELFYQYFPGDASFFALNTQINSGNRGHNVVKHYPRADYISLNEPELRLTAHNNKEKVDVLAANLLREMSCKYLSCTMGTKGAKIYKNDGQIAHIPALTLNAIDRVGAGDSYFLLSAMLLAQGQPFEVAGLLASALAALNVNIVANRNPVDKAAMKKYISTLIS